MNLPIDSGNIQKNLFNRENELALIQTAFDALIHKKNLLSTPIIDFFGIAGIGKTSLLQEISAKCIENNLPCIILDGSQNISGISSAILQQTQIYRQKSPQRSTASKRASHTQIVNAIKLLLNNNPVVILLDSIDASNVELVYWIETTLRALIEHHNLFVVLTSKQKIVFENDWLMARKLTPYQLKPLNRAASASYLKYLDHTISSEIREFIFRWTRGYPSAMEVMTKAILQHHFDIEKSADQQQLIKIIVEEIIDKKVLAHVKPSELDWFKDHLLLLSIPRRFNLVIMQELLEKFSSPSMRKPQSKLGYLGLSKQLNANADVLHWDLQKAGLTINESIRTIFFFYQRVHNFSLFTDIHQYLAEKNLEIAREVNGSDRVRYLREYLYHSAQSSNNPPMEAIVHPIEQKIDKLSSDDLLQLSEEFKNDDELKEILGKHSEIVYESIRKYFTQEE